MTRDEQAELSVAYEETKKYAEGSLSNKDETPPLRDIAKLVIFLCDKKT